MRCIAAHLPVGKTAGNERKAPPAAPSPPPPSRSRGTPTHARALSAAAELSPYHARTGEEHVYKYGGVDVCRYSLSGHRADDIVREGEELVTSYCIRKWKECEAVMLVFPSWRSEGAALGCRRSQWVPEARFASYVAPPPPALPRVPVQIEDEYSSSSCSSSPEHVGGGGGEVWGEVGAGAAAAAGERERECACEWRGCGVRARGVAALSAHVAREHAHAHHDGLFYCGWRACTRPHRGFNARYKMLVHVRTHTNEKPHACALCHKSFSRAENLKIHLRSHSGEKPYVCPFEGCNKAYSNSSDRFKHTRTHAEDKPYSCKVAGCDKRYTDPSSLRKHVKTYRHYASPPSPPSPPSPLRVPASDVPYIEYSRLCGDSASPSEGFYPKRYDFLLSHDDFRYERVYYDDVVASESHSSPPRPYEAYEAYGAAEAERPLDLKWRGGGAAAAEGAEGAGAGATLRVHSIEDSVEFQLLQAMELPLDLSNKN